MNSMKMMREKVRSLSVMLVDDEELVREGATVFLRKFFDKVDTAINGEMALEKFKSDGPYEILFTDIQMPKLRGDKLIEAVKEIDKNVFTVAMTGSTETDQALMDLSDVYLIKPINIDNMMKILNMLIERKNL